MDTRGWERAKELFHEALKLSGADRERLFADVDPEVREEVLALLGAHEEVGPARTTGSVEGEGPGTVIDRYKLLQEIGEGGFGVVYMAEQTEPVRRKVALKVIKLGMDTQAGHRPLRGRAPGAGADGPPQHRQVFDAGATEHGRPYFVMELVRGRPDHRRTATGSELDDRASGSSCSSRSATPSSTPTRRAIIHRDLKPSNVLVTLHDGRPVPKVIDFGIAKATDARLTEKTLFTELPADHRHARVHEPRAGGDERASTSTRAADIYSLGVLLYELLTGTTPFDTDEPAASRATARSSG